MSAINMNMENTDGDNIKPLDILLMSGAFCLAVLVSLVWYFNQSHNNAVVRAATIPSSGLISSLEKAAETAVRDSCQVLESTDVGWCDVLDYGKSPSSELILYSFGIDPNMGVRSSPMLHDGNRQQKANLRLAVSYPSYDNVVEMVPLASRDGTKIYIMEVRSDFPILGGGHHGPVYAVKHGNLDVELLKAGLPLW